MATVVFFGIVLAVFFADLSFLAAFTYDGWRDMITRL